MCSFWVHKRERMALVLPQSLEMLGVGVASVSKKEEAVCGTALESWVSSSQSSELKGFLAGFISEVQWKPVLCLRTIPILTNWPKMLHKQLSSWVCFNVCFNELSLRMLLPYLMLDEGSRLLRYRYSNTDTEWFQSTRKFMWIWGCWQIMYI